MKLWLILQIGPEGPDVPCARNQCAPKFNEFKKKKLIRMSPCQNQHKFGFYMYVDIYKIIKNFFYLIPYMSHVRI